jgi:putative aldouronate transport system substrate-binding protein
MKRKKIISAIVLLALLASLGLSGCKKESVSNSSKNKPVNLTWVMQGDKQKNSDAVWAEFNKKLAQKLPNTTLTIEMVPSNSYADKIQMMIAANENYDIMWASDWCGAYLDKVNGGAFMAIGDLLDKYAPHIKSELPAFALKAGTGADGKVYGLTGYQQLWTSQGVFMPKPLVDKYNIDMGAIQTASLDTNNSTADIFNTYITPILAKLKAGEPKVQTMYYPQLLEVYKDRLYEVIDSTGLAVIKRSDKTGNITVENLFKTQDFKDLIAMDRDWFVKGYFPKDILTASSNSPTVPKGQYSTAITFGNIGTPEDNQNQNSNMNTLGFATVQAMFAPVYNGHAAGSATMNFIGVHCKNPERAVQFLDLINSDADLYNLLCFGDAGIDYTTVNNPKADETPIIATTPATYGLWDWGIGNQLNSIGQSQFVKQDHIKKYNVEAVLSPVFGFRENTDNIKSQVASITAVITQYQNQLVYGVDSNYQDVYNQFIQKLDVAGAGTVISELQKQIDAFEKSNK